MAASDTAGPAIEAAFAPFREEGRALLPAGTAVLDAHTHLGLDEDGDEVLDHSGVAVGAQDSIECVVDLERVELAGELGVTSSIARLQKALDAL